MSIWAPVVAALGSSLLTGGAGFGTIWWQQRTRTSAAAISERNAAYHQLIAASLSFVLRARSVRDTMKIRSGMKEGLNVTFGIRPPIDPFELLDWFAKGFDPINQAWSKIQVIGSPEAVGVANELLDACANLVGAAGSVGTARGKVSAALGGIEWTAEEREALQSEAERVLACRSDFVRIARKEIGVRAAR